ncbi:MAG TPA: hypothetical protein VGR28_08085 [Candidatus Thermoplasmatota archaeon]|jgi:hypothetical protein|nr:hypothetical protein [Candidatus Thermoplasmatota archaeon]
MRGVLVGLLVLTPVLIATPASACGGGLVGSNCVTVVCEPGVFAISVVATEVSLGPLWWDFYAWWVEDGGIHETAASGTGPTFEHHVVRTDVQVTEYHILFYYTHGSLEENIPCWP